MDGFRRLGTAVRCVDELPLEQRNVHFTQERPLFREGGNIPPLVVLSTGARLLIIGMTGINAGQWVVVRRDDANMPDIEALRGRRLGIPLRAHERVDFHRALSKKILTAALASAGIAEVDVRWVDVVVSESYMGGSGEEAGSLWSLRDQYALDSLLFRALIKGEVDAIATRPPLAIVLAQVFDLRILVDVSVLDTSSNLYPIILTVDAGFAEAWPEAVSQYLRILREAADWASRHPAETRAIVARVTCAPEAAMVSYEPRDFHRRLAPTFDAHLVAKVHEQKEWLGREGFLQNDFDLERYLEPRFLTRGSGEAAGST